MVLARCRVECRRCAEDKSTHDAGLSDQARTKPCVTHGKPKGKSAMVNNRLLGVAFHSYTHDDLKSIEDVSTDLLDQVEQFFISYNKSRGKQFTVLSDCPRIISGSSF